MYGSLYPAEAPISQLSMINNNNSSATTTTTCQASHIPLQILYSNQLKLDLSNFWTMRHATYYAAQGARFLGRVKLSILRSRCSRFAAMIAVGPRQTPPLKIPPPELD
eukprot:scaffold12812_cov89-Skeletonema_dohrnii-CCMP3373.AAC.4